MYHPVDVAKAHQIMAKFRPIAPKPALSEVGPAKPTTTTTTPAAALCFRARPTRARKWGRAGLLPIPNKRQKPIFLPPLSLPVVPPQFTTAATTTTATSCSRPLPLVERDLLEKLQEPRVITPQPVRPVGSSISVSSITETPSLSTLKSKKKSEEVEEEVEIEAFPSVVSGSNNKVRIANSAYKEMVGQPECPWLESMVSRSCGLELETPARVSSRMINGEVALELAESLEIPVGSEGFSCRVKVEWACNGRKSCIEAPCEVIRVYCDSKDYLFTWKIHTTEAFGTTTNCKD